MDSTTPLGHDHWPAIERSSYVYEKNEPPTLSSSSSAAAIFLSDVHRNLASEKGYGGSYGSSAPDPIDYTALSVALMTLGLILIVEVCRHKIDGRVHGRPFATAVLETMYSELSTLGIVEFAIYLVQSYANYDKESKAVFAKVHFLLFYTAIINAMMSVLLAFLSSRISHKLWVRTEELELNHYLAIREEYGRVEKLMGEYEGLGSSTDEDEQAEQAVSLRHGWKHLRQMIQYPMLRRKYDKLLVQVRFHELRVHFLKANNLPLKFKVSDYLVKSELRVFKKCVHISAFAWIMVAAAVNVSYFFFGIVAYASESRRIVGSTMTWIFIGACIAFVPVSYVILNKMRWIFSQIMSTKLIDHNGDETNDEGIESHGADSLDDTRRSHKSVLDTNTSRRSTSRQGKALKQLDLFWGGDPSLIISAFQFMQLGYAIAASILLTFWDSINVYYATVPGSAFVLALLACYFSFLWNMSQMVPRYTLCTSLGDLTNQRRLHETQAKYKLEEARKKRRHLLEEQEKAAAIRDVKEKTNLVPPIVVKHTETSSQVTREHSKVDSDFSDLPKPLMMAELKPKSAVSHPESEKMAKLAELVHTDSADLPASSQSLTVIRKERRKRRMKAVSDGVSLMRRATESSQTSEDATIALSDETEPSMTEPGLLRTNTKTAASRQQMRCERRKKSISANVSLMRLSASSPDLASKTETEEEKPDESKKRSCLGNGMPILTEGIPSQSTHAPESSIPLSQATTLVTERSSALMSPIVEVNNDIHSANEGCSTGGEGRDEKDDDSVDSFDDIPNITASVLSAKLEQRARSSIDIQAFLQSKSYRLLSGLLGTMLVFFIIGMRVEVFLIESGTIPDTENTWHFGSLSSSFWWEVSWLSIFIVVSSCLLFCFFGSSDNLHLVVAGGSDVLLSAGCLALLLWAETKRCCQSGQDCCPKFGSRTYGGLGNIEPWTALIALRVFRFQFGRFVRKIVRRREGLQNDLTISLKVEKLGRAHELTGTSICPNVLQRQMQDIEEERERNRTTNKARNNFQNQTGTIVNLWKTAVGLHPEIVERHGPFSSELLQAMLAIEIVDNFSPATVPAAAPGTTSNQSDGDSAPPAPLTLSRRYTGLAPEAQGVILAGKIGLPVKAKIQRGPGLVSSSKMNDTIVPEKETEQFELDQVQNSEEHNDADEPSQMFVDPNAQLVRSMRRCERRLPPLLNEWAVVDVVLTKHELVYFDVSDDMGTISDSMNSLQDDENTFAALHKKKEAVRDAIIATKGGKGLRLRDIAVGRKVVGHVDLSDVSALKVERFLPLSQHVSDSAPRDVQGDEGIQEEYWKLSRHGNHSPREFRWKHTVEDRLKLSSTQGCLYLRFFADLEDWEKVKYEDLGDGEIIKDDALLWCQTIARLCGTDQLHQKLPHFGEEEGNAELLDFIHIICREHNVTDTNAMRDLQRRIKSRVNLAHLGDMIMGHPTPNLRAEANATPSVTSSMPSVTVALDRGRQDKEGCIAGLPL